MKQFSSLPRSRRLSIIFGIVIFIGVFFVLLAVLGSVKITKYRTYKNNTYRFTMKYPSYWDIMPHPKEGPIVAFRAPANTAMDLFIPNVNVTVQPLAEAKMFNFDVFSKEAIRQVAGLLEGALVVVESRPVDMAGRRSYRFIYTGKIEGVTDPMQYCHVWFFDGNKAIIITYAAPRSQFHKYLKTVYVMINSFKKF